MHERKKLLQMFTEGSVSDAVAAAREIANTLIIKECRGPGDIENAMRRIEAKYGIPHSFLWALRYRPPQDILMSAWQRLVGAYDLECARQKRLYDAEAAKAKALKNAASRALARTAGYLAGEED